MPCPRVVRHCWSSAISGPIASLRQLSSLPCCLTCWSSSPYFCLYNNIFSKIFVGNLDAN
ncbi:hypothetical protein HN51_022838, partial [Arachis hypogaea]